jgi:hypothetical protein
MKTTRLKHFKRSCVVALFSALCLVMGTVTTSLAAGVPGRSHPVRASSPPDGMSWPAYHLMMEQMPLDAAATKIQALAAKPGPAHRGFFETKVIPSQHTLVVYWHGPVPSAVRHLISSLRAKISVQVVKTRYSLAALNRDVLTAIHTDHGVTGGWPLNGGNGIHLGVRSGSPAMVAAAMQSRFGVPVVVSQTGVDKLLYCAVPGSNANLGPGSRCNDLENFWGGDVIQSDFVFCSGGFGVHNSSGGEYLLTAAHCADNGSGYANGINFWNGQDPSHWAYVGQITDVPGNHDAAVIPTGTGNQYYDGPGIYNGDTTHTKTVAGQQATSVGDSLCESGAFGGVKCGFIVTRLNASIVDPNYGSPTWTALALANPGSAGNPIEGDSGGPWFSLDGCCTHVWAKGITHGLYFGQAVFTPITVASSDMGVSVNRG